ncbi:TetR/AcrR family transcriptional regulator [Sphingopyxis flava]|uniref:Transcriptional regulator, TetR family n=1 Tax=Sphingopyxis flava TaxID=1507287 RepID=A0A1T5EUW2_9SPHN|nr:TetR/AcrR family transcriptional regulator [Sphingopyxis flava]SKB87735.1 transcriptional regulator, TetR family [Sphingopyxis flava]
MKHAADLMADRRETQRRRILDVARRHFLTHGYGATTMSAIAADVGGSKSDLWSHFNSKESLFAAFVDTDSRDFHTDTLALLDRAGEVFEILSAFVDGFVAAVSSPAALRLQRQVAAEADRIAVGDLLYERLVGVVETRLVAFFDAHMREGALRRGDPRSAAWLLIALCFGLDPRRLFCSIEEIGAAASSHGPLVVAALKVLLNPTDGAAGES